MFARSWLQIRKKRALSSASLDISTPWTTTRRGCRNFNEIFVWILQKRSFFLSCTRIEHLPKTLRSLDSEAFCVCGKFRSYEIESRNEENGSNAISGNVVSLEKSVKPGIEFASNCTLCVKRLFKTLLPEALLLAYGPEDEQEPRNLESIGCTWVRCFKLTVKQPQRGFLSIVPEKLTGKLCSWCGNFLRSKCFHYDFHPQNSKSTQRCNK